MLLKLWFKEGFHKIQSLFDIIAIPHLDNRRYDQKHVSKQKLSYLSYRATDKIKLWGRIIEDILVYIPLASFYQFMYIVHPRWFK